MNETKNYKNININELGLKHKITYKASRIALFVPKSLAKLAKKLIVKPITELVTGKDYDKVMGQAVKYTMMEQEIEAEDLAQRFDEGMRNLKEWYNDKEYYIGNLAAYKAYESTLFDLMRKYNKLVNQPRRLLVAKNYLVAMKQSVAKRSNSKKVKAVVKEYQERTEKIRNLEEQIKEEKRALDVLKRDNPSIIEQFVAFLENNQNSITSQEVTPSSSVQLENEQSSQQSVRTQGASSNSATIMEELEKKGAFARPYTPKPAPSVVPGTSVEPEQNVVPPVVEAQNAFQPAPSVVPGTSVESEQNVVPPVVEVQNAFQPAPSIVPETSVEPTLSQSDEDLLAQMGSFAKQAIKVKPVQRNVSNSEYEEIMGRKK